MRVDIFDGGVWEVMEEEMKRERDRTKRLADSICKDSKF